MDGTAVLKNTNNDENAFEIIEEIRHLDGINVEKDLLLLRCIHKILNMIWWLKKVQKIILEHKQKEHQVTLYQMDYILHFATHSVALQSNLSFT